MSYEYLEKLKDPRWQKKRLEVFQRENFTCQCCDETEATLHVHHLIYSKGEPWDAPLETLECLCENCHNFREEFNSIGDKRTLAPTRLCYAFFRFTCLHYTGKGDCFEEFSRFWSFIKITKPETVENGAPEEVLDEMTEPHQ